jgi:hypothetical protein
MDGATPPAKWEKNPAAAKVTVHQGVGGLVLLAAAHETGLLSHLETAIASCEPTTPHSLLSSSPYCLRQLMLTLLFLPLSGVRRTHDLRGYTADALAVVTGRKRAYGYCHTERFLSQFAKANGSEALTTALGSWTAHLWHFCHESQEPPCFYIDGHRKPVHADCLIPRGLIGRSGKILGGRALTLLHDEQGHPHLATTSRADQHLTVGLPQVLARYEQAGGKTAQARIIAFRCVCETDVQNSLSGVLYEALVAQRRPGPSLPTGLLWHIPKHLVMEAPVPQECQTFCQQLGVINECVSTVPPWFIAIEEAWDKELSGQVIEAQYYALLFDTVLQKMQGYGPQRAQRERERDYHRLIGYRADPAWQFPLLRALLTSHSTTITEEGMISFNDLHYAHPLLRCWPGVPVTLRLPVETEACLWVFVENEILCQAYAQELRRSDGSYRAWRSERA